MTMNIQQDEYVTEAGDTAGIVVVIQPQNQMPFPEDDGTLVSPGFTTSIAVVQVTTTQRYNVAATYALSLCLRPLTHAPEIGAIYSMPDSGASFSCRCATSNVVHCLRSWRRIYCADFWTVCQGPQGNDTHTDDRYVS